MTWLYLALLAPLLYAIINLFDDNLLQHVYKRPHIGTIISGVFGLLPAAVILALGLPSGDITPSLALLSLAAGFATVIGFYFYFKAFSVANPSVVIVLFSLAPAIVPFVAYYLVNERLSTTAYAGFAIIIISAFLYSIVDAGKLKWSKAILPALLAAGILDVVSLANKFIYTKTDFYTSYVYFALGMAAAGFLFWALMYYIRRKVLFRQIIKKNSLLIVLLLIFVELLGIAAEFVHARALSLGPVSIVSVLENLQPLYLLAIAALMFPFFPKYFREAEAGNIKLKVLLALVMLGGVYLAAS